LCSHGSRRRFAPPHHEGLRDRPASSLRSALFARVWKDVPRTDSRSRNTMRPSFAINVRPGKGAGACDPQERTQGMPGVRCTRGSGKKCPGVVPQVHRLQPAFPARWFYGLFRALPGDRAFLPPSLARRVGPVRADIAYRKLDASVGASGPHDFAVRDQRRSSTREKRATAWPAFTASRLA
jgi:hypothetical protein